MPAAAMRALVGQLPGLEVVRVLRPRRGVSALSVTPDEATEVYVARIDPDRVELIRQMMPPQLVVVRCRAHRCRAAPAPRDRAGPAAEPSEGRAEGWLLRSAGAGRPGVAGPGLARVPAPAIPGQL